MKSGRAILFRVGALILLLVIAALMLVIGRGHTVYFDNKTLDYANNTYEAPYKVVVFVNGKQVAKLNKKERGMATWIGQDFKMTLEITKEKGGEETVSSYSVKLPYNMDGVIINLPAYLAGLPEEAYISQFVPSATEEAVEEPATDEFGIPEMESEPESGSIQ